VLSLYVVKRLRSGSRRFELGVEYALASGSFLGVRGPSGSGKSTLLRCLAGLARPDSGHIESGGSAWFDSSSRVNLSPRRRPVGMVFQDYALFPNMTVLGNLLYARDDLEAAMRLLELVRMEGLARQYPSELSGGQRQRAALARALARGPELLLLDEPMSALDEELRDELGDELRRVQRETGVTAIMVSHSRPEVSRLCDEVLELKDGAIDDSRLSVY
jgi:ABC-type spermidine/putrescine transport systems, ATPase components